MTCITQEQITIGGEKNRRKENVENVWSCWVSKNSRRNRSLKHTIDFVCLFCFEFYVDHRSQNSTRRVNITLHASLVHFIGLFLGQFKQKSDFRIIEAKLKVAPFKSKHTRG